MEFHATVQPMGFDSSGCANFRAYRFVENTPFGFWILACMEFHATVQSMEVDSSGAPNFCTYPYLETILLGVSATLPSTPAARNYFSFYPPYEN